jgi:hypothetical protein
MTTFNTGNPIGSTDARDRSDNSENLDLAVNSLSQTFVDRLGRTRDTLEGIYQKSAYYRAGTFGAGYTLTNNRQTLAYGNVEYSWSGAFPKVVSAGSTPATSGGVGAGGWVDRTDDSLRDEIRETVFQTTKRSYAEAGYNIVDGSFEAGGTLVNPNDALLQERTGKAFSGPAGTVAAGTDPAGGGFVDRSDQLTYITSREVSVLRFIPKNLHQYLNDVNQSRINAGDLSAYLANASAYCDDNGLCLTFPSGYFYVGSTFMAPVTVKGTLGTYILAMPSLLHSPVISVDYAGQRTYSMECLHVIGNRTGYTPGLRIGGCRNSVFKQLVFTSCSVGALIYPTHPDSGDVENIELDHIWTVQCGIGLHVAANNNINRGNITDGKLQNLQLTADAAEGGDGIPLMFTAAPGKLIFGLHADRVFTSAGINTHMYFQPNGGIIYSNFFSNITGEPRGLVEQRAQTIVVSSGDFYRNDFRNIYPIGMPGNGIVLSNGSVGNTFRGLGFSDSQISNPGTNNKWIEVQPGANFNVFEINKQLINDSFYLGGPTNAISSNVALGDIGSGAKMVDLGIGNSYEGAFTSKPTVLVPRSKIFSLTGTQLTNYPLPGCVFIAAGEGFVVQVPAGSAEYVLSIPHKMLNPGRDSPLVSVMLAYECPTDMKGLQVSIGVDTSFKAITDYRAGTWRYMTFTSNSGGSSGAINIKFSGTRIATADFYVWDLVISAGEELPFNKNLIRSVFDNA